MAIFPLDSHPLDDMSWRTLPPIRSPKDLYQNHHPYAPASTRLPPLRLPISQISGPRQQDVPHSPSELPLVIMPTPAMSPALSNRNSASSVASSNSHPASDSSCSTPTSFKEEEKLWSHADSTLVQMPRIRHTESSGRSSRGASVINTTAVHHGVSKRQKTDKATTERKARAGIRDPIIQLQQQVLARRPHIAMTRLNKNNREHSKLDFKKLEILQNSVDIWKEDAARTKSLEVEVREDRMRMADLEREGHSLRKENLELRDLVKQLMEKGTSGSNGAFKASKKEE
ncbi:hypothetical protein K402DRAFT_403275 [Aulographum hederae CBS 113979]|uniref:Uncharacterized protein n=1 Tax=Aulographum hederae CBS 113979 TaxID=1176131 RepID=A0A6G1H4F6_9PEZI|nr:hypothetical protein K402DRAFT_403275 [Aulographum hederae CBS 113979]